MPLTRELVQAVRRRIADNPSASPALLAEQLRASEAEIITALPLGMRLRAKNSAFESIWDTVARWPDIVINPARQPARIWPRLPELRTSGQFRPEEIGFIWFVSKPFLDKESHSVQFFTHKGAHMLSLYLGQNASGAFDKRAKADYEAMRERFGVIPVPRNRCKGCARCTCDAAAQ